MFVQVFVGCRCHFWHIVGAKIGSLIDFGGNRNLMQKRVCSSFKDFEKGWILGPGASWCLVLGKRAKGIVADINGKYQDSISCFLEDIGG